MTRNQYGHILWLFCIISPFTLVPFERAITRFVGLEPLALTPWGLIMSAVGATFIYGWMVFLGMHWARKIGTRFLLLEDDPDFYNDLLKPGLIAGIICTVAILFFDAVLPASPMNLFAFARSVPPAVGFFGLFFCIVNQQVYLSLFCVSGFALLLKTFFDDLSEWCVFAVSIFVTALLFGLAHIPTFVNPAMPDVSLVIMRIMVLNIFSGVTFGMLYWKKGFEAAVWGHVVVDVILYVLVPLYASYVR
jgi:hypothetical protein